MKRTRLCLLLALLALTGAAQAADSVPLQIELPKPLFAGTPRRFRDAVLAEARLELFLPGVEILADGDAVNEMHLIVRGRAESRSPLAGGAGATTDSADGGAPAAPTAGVRQLGVGDLCGELAFFTEEPQASSVTSTTTVRVLTIQRGSLDSTLRAFPAAARTGAISSAKATSSFLLNTASRSTTAPAAPGAWRAMFWRRRCTITAIIISANSGIFFSAE